MEAIPVSYTHLDVYKRQVIDYAPEGDITLASAVSKQLANYGYLGGASNTSAVYLKMCIRDRLISLLVVIK